MRTEARKGGENVISLNHKYALLENGTIEPLFYSDGEPRMAYQGEDGKHYLDHDVWGEFMGRRACFYCRHEIIKTSDDRDELEGGGEDG